MDWEVITRVLTSPGVSAPRLCFWAALRRVRCELRREAFFPAPPNGLPSHPTLSLRPTSFSPVLTMEEEKDQEEETKEKGHRDPDENINLLRRQACGSWEGGIRLSAVCPYGAPAAYRPPHTHAGCLWCSHSHIELSHAHQSCGLGLAIPRFTKPGLRAEALCPQRIGKAGILPTPKPIFSLFPQRAHTTRREENISSYE